MPSTRPAVYGEYLTRKPTLDPADGSADFDADGLTNAQELALGTNMRLVDTDADGLSDGLEVLTYNTDPLKQDSDDDFIPDGVEIEWRMNPLDAGDAFSDTDGDGFSARQEFLAGTSPVSASSAPQVGAILRIEPVPSNSTLSSTTVASDGTLYLVSDEGLEALNPDRSSKWLWRSTSVVGNAALGADGTVYVATSSTTSTRTSELVALSPYNGRELWSVDLRSLGGRLWSVKEPPSIGSDGMIYQPVAGQLVGDGYIVAVDRSGIVRGVKEVRVERDGPTIAVDHEGRIIQAGSAREITAYRFVSGSFEQVWQSIGTRIRDGAQLALGGDGTIYLADRASFEAVSNTGEPLWRRTGNSFRHPRVLPDGRVVVQNESDGYRLRMYSAGGALLWSHTSAQSPVLVGATSIDAHNVIHVATETGTLAVSEDGAILMQTTVPGGVVAVNYPIVQPDGLVWFETYSSRVLVAGSAHGLADSWASMHRDHRNQRNAVKIDDVPPDPAPLIGLVSPSSGSTMNIDVGQQLTARARASDLLDGDISATVRWMSSRDGELGVGASLSVNSLSVGAHTITVMATNAEGISSSDTFTVNVGLIGPSVIIFSPFDEEAYEVGLPVRFLADAYDDVDGYLEDSVRWSSSIDGALGTGIFERVLSAGRHVITATVSDSNGTTATDTSTIHVQAMPPYVEIDSPSNFSTVSRGTEVYFDVYAEDELDGDLAESAVWTSSLDGQFGTGDGFSIANLSPGRHQITASVTDSDGATGLDTHNLTVSDPNNAAPFVSISAPAANAQFYVGDLVRMQASAFDSGGSIATVEWHSSIDGALGTGSQVESTTLSAGEHVLRVVVTDNAGAKAAAKRSIRVLPIPDNFPPTVTITSFLTGGVYTQGSVIPLFATAVDREHGDVSDSIVWSSSIDGELGRAAAVYATLSAGTHDLTATATDPEGATSSVTHRIEVASDGQAMHMVEPFTGSQPFSRDGWEVVNDTGNQSGGVNGSWFVSGGRAVEAAGGYRNHTDTIARPGTYLIQTAGTYWTDYSVRLTMRSATSNGTMYGMGLMFRVKDNDNYYRFSMDRTNSFRRLVKKVNGTYTTLWQDTVAYTQGGDYQLEVRAEGSTITVLLDGTQLYSGSDSAHERGTIALYTWRSRNAGFDNVEVTNLTTASSNYSPVLFISSQIKGSSVIVGTPFTLSGTATDVEDGLLSNTIVWTSDLSGDLGTGASLSVGDLAIGTHTISASVTDSNGRQTKQSVTVTVTDAGLGTGGGQ